MGSPRSLEEFLQNLPGFSRDLPECPLGGPGTRKLVKERFGDYGTATATGAFVAFSGANQVTGATSSAVGTPDSTADSAVTLTGGNSITFTDGYANSELDPDSGNVIYIENRKPISRASDQTEDIKLM